MPAKHAKDLQETYATISKGFVSSHGDDVDIPLLDGFLQLLPAGGKILELGSGVGRDAEYFINKGWDVTLFDLSSELLAIAKQRIPHAHIIQGDMLDYPFQEESYEGIFSSMTFLHLTKVEMKEMMMKVNKILKPHGILLFKMREGDEERITESQKYGKPMKRFFAYYQEDELVTIVENAGFHVIDHYAKKEDSPERTLFIVARK